MDRLYAFNHAPIEFYFRQSANDFVVEEIPLYQFSGEGEHLILHVRKKNLSTFDLVALFANYLGIQRKEIGYAGLKDKHALTYQYISLHKKYEEKMQHFSHENVKILSTTYHNNKLRTGHLKGNRFFIRVKKVNPTDAKKIDEVLKKIAQDGMPNFFGYQRFGTNGDNHILGEKIAKGEKKERNPKVRKFLISAYQSHLFNLWLSKRIELSKLIENFSIAELETLLNIPKTQLKHLKEQSHPLKIFQGDIMQHYPHGRLFEFDTTSQELERFYAKDVSVTGLLCGKRAKLSSGFAREIEKSFDENILADGARRYAWIFPEDVEGRYIQEEAWYEFHFSLPKGSYATVLLEEIAKKEIKE
jgi:tRNA pseudouridine13 synthase